MSSQYVSPEYRGLARGFRRRVEVAEIAYDNALIKSIIDPLRERLRRKPTVRKDNAIDIARILRSISNPYRFSSSSELTKRGHLKINDVILGLTEDRKDHWEGDEFDRTVGIVRIEVTMEGRQVHIDSVPLATISAHALARWYERSRSRDEAKLLSDIAMILHAEQPDHAPASRGLWLGSISNAHAKVADREVKLMKVRLIRTYIDADMVHPARSFSRERAAVAA